MARYVALLVAAVLAIAGCSSSTSLPDADEFDYRPTLRTVLYEVEGTATGASLTIATPSGTRQVSDAAVPVTREASGERGLEMTVAPGEFLYISAQNNHDTGTITCRITVDGVVISENSSSGAYAIASCSGTA